MSAEWGLLLAAVSTWIVAGARQPWMGAGALLVVGSFVARGLRTGRLSRSTPIDRPLVLFAMSALLAFWVAPDRSQATYRLLLLLGAIGIFYAIVNSEAGDLETVSDGFVILVAASGLYLASQHDWTVAPARFATIGTIGQWLNQWAPRLESINLHWNVVRNGMAAVLGLALPIALVRFADTARRRRTAAPSLARGAPTGWLRAAVLMLAAGLILFGLAMTESRTPWLVYLIIAGLALWWWMSGRISSWLRVRREHTFLLVTGIAAFLAALGLLAVPAARSLFSSLPGPNSAVSRAEIFTQSWKLAQDTPFTGGGLGQLPALYSTYIQVIPHALFLSEDTGNNAYLNVLVEQGWLGLLSLIAVLGIAAYAAAVLLADLDGRSRSLAIAGALGLAFVVLYGLSHAVLVATRAIPFLLIPAGLVLGADKFATRPSPRNSRLPVLIIMLAVPILVVVAASAWRPLTAAWHANLGAIGMARLQLVNWPTNEWKDGSGAQALLPAAGSFGEAIRLDPTNRAAHYRLGLISIQQRDFEVAVFHLELAHDADPSHRGIRKSLGYAYAWTGQFDRAYLLHSELPETAEEMRVYAWWWRERGRDDLSANSEWMARLLTP